MRIMLSITSFFPKKIFIPVNISIVSKKTQYFYMSSGVYAYMCFNK